jgi:serine/threonine protein phosphatase 1
MSKWRPSDPCLFVIPDLNGNINLLQKVCARILPLRKSEGIVDKIIFLGDYMDRNIDSHLVLDFLIDLRKKYKDQIVFLFGNHEEIILKTMNLMPNEKFSLDVLNTYHQMWLHNGGFQTLAGYLNRAGIKESPMSFPRYRIADVVPDEHIEFLQNALVNYYETEQFIFVHGGCDPTIPLNQQTPEALWWDRDLCKFVKNCINNNQQEKINWKKCIVTGHNASIKPVIHEKFMMLDISATRKELLVTELNSLSAMVAHVDKDRFVAYDLQETEIQKQIFKRVTQI